jgi:uncharacterized protein (DUF885 family)
MTNNHVPQLALLVDDYLRDFFAFYPVSASMLGLHEYDGQITDMSKASLALRIEALHDYQKRLHNIERPSLDKLAGFDYDLLQWRIAAELWHWTERQDYTRNPMVYADDMMVDTYIKRNYAPLGVRAEALTRHLNQIPTAMDSARENLVSPIPRLLIEESLPVFAGLVVFLQESLPVTFSEESLPTALYADLRAACEQAITAIEQFIHYVTYDLLPQAQDDFALGAEQFSAMLRYGELIDMPLDQLLAYGQADLERNKAAIIALAASIDPHKSVHEHMHMLGRDHPTTENLLDETRRLLDDLRQFLVERDLVTLPQTGTCLVAETPPFARWAFAMMDTAGPFEQVATESFYYVTLPEPDWSPEVVEGWLTKFDYATMTGVSIHEAYPGHYVHFMRVREAPTRLAKTVDTYTHYESWAHYVEQMMLDEGYGDGDVRLRLSQLAEALVRNCRYICAIKMHTQGMGVAEATRFFMYHAYMDEVTATKEARRGTHDPGYICYTLGKLLLLKLREDVQAAQGDAFSLKQFHDEYIGYGSPPIPILRSLLLPGSQAML